MATMAENVIATGSETRPPMLDKGMYDSWKTWIMLYIQGKENGEMLNDSVINGPYKFKSEITAKDTDSVTDICREERLEDLKGDDKLRYDSDIKAINILLLGLPIDIYTLINHYQTAKEIWDRVKELMEGAEMTKQERESMLYDEFDKFTFEPEESIRSYYLRYSKLINDMNMIPMSMTPMQINTKFVKHLQLEWSRFVTAVKQARDLHSVTFDQLYTFLKHNEKDSKEVREMQQRFPDALALMEKTYNLPPSYSSNQTRQSQGYAGNAANNQALGARVINAVGNTGANEPRLQATTNFKADYVDAYDSDYDDEATANTILMANFSPVGSLNDDTVATRYDSDTLSKVPHYETYLDSDVLNSNIQELGYIENIVSTNESYDELKGNNDVISHTDYMVTIRDDEDNYVPPPVQKDDMMLFV
ncbi:hypothetical protein Tco_0431895 [Tanacetum coccineum]